VKVAPLISSLNAGELGPNLDGRSDLQKYGQGARVSENFLHLIAGPACRRGGTRFISEIKNSANRSWIVEFEFSASQAFALEFGDSYVRFFTKVGTARGHLLVTGVAAYNGATNYVPGDLAVQAGVTYYCIAATVGNAPPNATYWYALTGSIYEIPSPYTIADLTNADGTCALSIQQSGDVLYIAHASRAFQTRTLTRFADTNWRFGIYDPPNGPFDSLNSSATTMYASAATGAITLNASTATFAPSDIGRLARLESQNFEDPWEAGKAYNINDVVRSDGKTYKATNSATSGTAQPIHDRGDSKDGKAGVNWRYQHSGYGVARISAYTNSTTVSATVLTDPETGLLFLPALVVGIGNATTRWQLGSWSATTGYPGAVTFFKGRLALATKLTLHLSVPNDFSSMAEDFFGELRDDCAINWPVSGQDVNEVLWIEGGDKLIVGTGGGELVGGEQNPNNPLSPSNFQLVQQSKRRVRGIQPIVAGTSLVYAQRAGQKLLSMDYAIERDRFISVDQTLLNDRITRTGMVTLCFQGEPDSMIWVVRADGKLVVLTLDADQNVVGWGRHPIGGDGFVEDAIALPSPDGAREDLWLIVRRTINGVTRRYIEVMEGPWEGADEDGTNSDDQVDAFYVDCGLTYDGPPATVFSGLSHLEGKTVQVLADGAVVSPDPVVSGGSFTLVRAASTVQVGLQFISRLVPMRIEVPTQDGTSAGKMKRANAATIRFKDTLGGRAGTYRNSLENLSFRAPSTPMGSATPIVANQDVDTTFGGTFNTDGLLEVRQEQPLPMTIVAIMPRMAVNGR
jgi:hypothetical protein